MKIRFLSLSPLMGAFYLAELDEKAEKLPVFYVRYMDDILMMSEKRGRLKKGIRVAKRGGRLGTRRLRSLSLPKRGTVSAPEKFLYQKKPFQIS